MPLLLLLLMSLSCMPSAPAPPASPAPPVMPAAPARLASPARPALPALPARAPRLALPSAYQWPVAPARVVRRFDPPPERWLPGHRGVDLAAVPDAPVRSAGAGTVAFAGLVAGRGVVTVAHAGGLRTTYEPVTAVVGPGDRVTAGDPLGTIQIGHAGCTETACLHWGLRRGGDYLDPLALLGLGRVRLLPL